ncbi:MAG TPA: peptidoglycan-associated lipoprotein Pal [Geobacteraceae bacterium]
MRKGMMGLFVILCCGALLVGGCAKKEVVKGEEAPAAAAPKPAETPAEQAPAKAPVKEEKVQEQAVKEAAPAKEEAPAPQAELTTILFDFDSYVLTASARETLTKNAEAMQKDKSIKVRVEGNCDERGSDEYNLALGEKRAKAAMNYLVSLGIPGDRLSIISYGKEKPVDPGHDEAAWAKNRRDDFVVIK